MFLTCTKKTQLRQLYSFQEKLNRQQLRPLLSIGWLARRANETRENFQSTNKKRERGELRSTVGEQYGMHRKKTAQEFFAYYDRLIVMSRENETHTETPQLA